MRTMTKLVCGCFGVGALVLLGTSAMQTPVAPALSGDLGTSSGGAFIQSATGAVGPAAQRAIATFTANAKSMADSAGSYFDRHDASFELQFRIFASNASSRLAARGWLPKSALSWLQSNAQVATQASTAKAKSPARKAPAMRVAMQSASHHAGAPRQPVNSPAGF